MFVFLHEVALPWIFSLRCNEPNKPLASPFKMFQSNKIGLKEYFNKVTTTTPSAYTRNVFLL